MSELAARECKPCRGDTPRLTGDALPALRAQLDPAWEVIDEHHLARSFAFRNFREALAFTNRVGELAEAQNHHPDLHLAWGKVRLELWTHAIDGLSESDFVFAAKLDRLPRP